MLTAKRKIIVGMSGGVDSSLTAALLQEQGHDVFGVHMQNWHDSRFIKGCSSWPEDRQDALRVARHLGLSFEVVNFQQAYRERVIEYFFSEYQAGRTPNPDMLCNREIKFGMLLDWARERGYDFVATGHYAVVKHDTNGSRLYRGVDTNKDQSYFLAQLRQDQLRHALFPLGKMIKPQVRTEAAKRGLPVADKPDSQGLCFVGEINLTEFLGQRIPAETGPVRTSDGTVVGEHQGAAFYTVGQRRGVGVSKPVPHYVLGTDLATNTVTVGLDRELYHRTVVTEPPHWLSGSAPDGLESNRLAVSIRYRMRPEPATVKLMRPGLGIRFDEPQRGPTPGQFAALYRDQELLGSAVIR